MYNSDDMLVPELDVFLENYNEENDRAPDVISPSLCGTCGRQLVLARVISGNRFINARLRRIFDNGTEVHNRLQKYLTEQGILLMDEVPLRNDYYNLQGHTDGLLDLYGSIYSHPELSVIKPSSFSPFIVGVDLAVTPTPEWRIKELGVLEIKSIKQENYDLLKQPEGKHVTQASVYMYCLEERRCLLQESYPSWKEFIASEPERIGYFKGVYHFFKGGARYTKEQKVERKVKECLIADNILYLTSTPIEKAVFMYENKNTQEIKEFVIEYSSPAMGALMKQFRLAEESIKFIRWFNKGKPKITHYSKKIERLLPEKDGKSKYCKTCKYCDYNELCWLR